MPKISLLRVLREGGEVIDKRNGSIVGKHCFITLRPRPEGRIGGCANWIQEIVAGKDRGTVDRAATRAKLEDAAESRGCSLSSHDVKIYTVGEGDSLITYLAGAYTLVARRKGTPETGFHALEIWCSDEPFEGRLVKEAEKICREVLGGG